MTSGFKSASPLVNAAANGQIDIVKKLIATGASLDLNAKADNGDTALMATSKTGCAKIAKLLIDAGADVNVKDNRRIRKKLWEDFVNGTKNYFRKIKFPTRASGRVLVHDKLNKQIRVKEQYTDSEQEQFIGAFIMLVGGLFGCSIYFIFIVIRLIVLSIRTIYGRNALMAASVNGHTEIVKMLIDAGADVNIKDDMYRLTALMAASRQGHAEIVKLLIDAGADVNAKNNQTFTSLVLASEAGHTETVKLLIDADADIDAKVKPTTTALHIVSEKGHTEIVKLFVDAGADVHIKNNKGLTALQIASKENHADIVKLLVATDPSYIVLNKK